MWLDFNKNFENTKNVAIVVSVQGVNAITGLPTTDAQLEQYITKCPKCGTEFGPERYCAKCKQNWTKQNYISTTSTPSGQLWIDGFRTIEGAVRQYLFTQDVLRGVAKNKLGAERVFAIGISFFESKAVKPTPTPTTFACNNLYKGVQTGGMVFGSSIDIMDSTMPDMNQGLQNRVSDHFDETPVSYCSTQNVASNNIPDTKANRRLMGALQVLRGHNPVETKKLEIAAGAKITQQLHEDTESLDMWQTEPSAILCINYCAEDFATNILNLGKIVREVNPEGFLQAIPFGN